MPFHFWPDALAFRSGERANYRKGITPVLKLADLTDAKAQDYTRILMYNESRKRAMLSINERLGFVRQPAWLNYTKLLS